MVEILVLVLSIKLRYVSKNTLYNLVVIYNYLPIACTLIRIERSVLPMMSAGVSHHHLLPVVTRYCITGVQSILYVLVLACIHKQLGVTIAWSSIIITSNSCLEKLLRHGWVEWTQRHNDVDKLHSCHWYLYLIFYSSSVYRFN